MPTRPARRERRRAERRKASKHAASLPESAPCCVADFGPMSPSVFMHATPVVRKVMRVILIQTSFATSQVYGFELWKDVLERVKPRPSDPHYDQHEYQVLCFEAIIELHDMHIYELRALQLDYTRQVAMWGLECSKPKEDWDPAFIARRELELAQLNRLTKKVALAFEEKLQKILDNGHAFSSHNERGYLLQTLDRFRDNFAKGVDIADQETAAALKGDEVLDGDYTA